MVKYIFYILLGLFLISEYASVLIDAEEYKLPCTIKEAKYNFVEADTWLCQKSDCTKDYSCQTDAGNIGNSILFRCISPSKFIRSDYSFTTLKMARTLKNLLSGKTTTTFPFDINPLKVSYRYYVYTLRHILV